MKLHQMMNGAVVLGQYTTNNGTVLLMRRQTKLDVEFIVATAHNEQEWINGSYFHAAEYKTIRAAQQAAKMDFLLWTGLYELSLEMGKKVTR